ncbi:MAG: AraC family transcriptional regulator [Thermoanaerobaculia bacterium]|nr:AraC family transcriptional regulator [Thermoanaerobaculia bacterium]
MPDNRAIQGIHPADVAPPDCLGRINRAIDFILANLHRSHTLDDIARAVYLSPFHFHRVFQSIVGETPAQFTRRVRLERAISTLSHDPARSLTSVALDCGFASSSDFSRAFKRRYGVPPSAFDIETLRAERRDEIRRIVEAGGGVAPVLPPPKGENPDGFEVVIRELPPRQVAYRRVLQPFREDVVAEAAERLVDWAESLGLADSAWYGYMWDDPKVVALNDCRYDVAVACPEPPPARSMPGDVGLHRFPGMLVAEVAMDGGIDVEMRLFDWVYRVWLPTSGYLPDDQPCFEAWTGRPFAHGLERFELAVQLPVCRA